MGGLAAAATAIVVVAVIASATVAVAALATSPLNSGRVLVDSRAAAAIVEELNTLMDQ
jgi:hypothetical protein